MAPVTPAPRERAARAPPAGGGGGSSGGDRTGWRPDREGPHVPAPRPRRKRRPPTMTPPSTPGPARTRTAPAVPVDGDRPARGAGPDADVTDADLVARL